MHPSGVTKRILLITGFLFLCVPGLLQGQPVRAIPFELDFGTFFQCSSESRKLFLVNESSIPRSLTSAVITGPQAGEYMFSPPSFTSIAAGASESLYVTLAPTGPGTKIAFLELRFSPGGVITVPLQGVVNASPISFSPLGLDFGNVDSARSKVLSLRITNTSSVDVQIETLVINGPNAVHFSVISDPTPFLLLAGQSASLDVGFFPDSAGMFRAWLNIRTNECNGRLIVISLDGVGNNPEVAHVKLPPEIHGAPGEQVRIPIILENPILSLSPARVKWSCVFSYNPTTLLPVDIVFDQNIPTNSASWTFLAPGEIAMEGVGPLPAQVPGALATLVMRVYIGDAVRFPLRLKEFEFENDFPFSRTTDGVFVLDSVCQAERRIITSKTKTLTWNVYPNPFNPSANLTVDVPIEKNIRIYLLDLLGRRTRIIFEGRLSAGRHVFSIKGSNLSGGVYFLQLLSGTEANISRILLLK